VYVTLAIIQSSFLYPLVFSASKVVWVKIFNIGKNVFETNACEQNTCLHFQTNQELKSEYDMHLLNHWSLLVWYYIAIAQDLLGSTHQ